MMIVILINFFFFNCENIVKPRIYFSLYEIEFSVQDLLGSIYAIGAGADQHEAFTFPIVSTIIG